jgi:acyl carrier protein
MTNEQDTRMTIRTFVLERFPEARVKSLADDDSLLDSGVVDSLGILEFATFIEEQFCMQLQDDDLTPEHFDSVASIANFVESSR